MNSFPFRTMLGAFLGVMMTFGVAAQEPPFSIVDTITTPPLGSSELMAAYPHGEGYAVSTENGLFLLDTSTGDYTDLNWIDDSNYSGLSYFYDTNQGLIAQFINYFEDELDGPGVWYETRIFTWYLSQFDGATTSPLENYNGYYESVYCVGPGPGGPPWSNECSYSEGGGGGLWLRTNNDAPVVYFDESYQNVILHDYRTGSTYAYQDNIVDCLGFDNLTSEVFGIEKNTHNILHFQPGTPATSGTLTLPAEEGMDLTVCALLDGKPRVVFKRDGWYWGWTAEGGTFQLFPASESSLCNNFEHITGWFDEEGFLYLHWPNFQNPALLTCSQSGSWHQFAPQDNLDSFFCYGEASSGRVSSVWTSPYQSHLAYSEGAQLYYITIAKGGWSRQLVTDANPISFRVWGENGKPVISYAVPLDGQPGAVINIARGEPLEINTIQHWSLR